MNNLELGVFNFFHTCHIARKEKAIAAFSELRYVVGEEVQQNFESCVESVNAYLKQYDLELTEGKSEVSGEDFIALVQICENNVTENARFGDKKVSAFFSKLMTGIVLSKSGHLSEMDAINMAPEVQITKIIAENVIQDFKTEMWLEEKDGLLFLGPRGVMELGEVLANHYPNSKYQCPLCVRTIFFGISCKSCKSKIHFHCVHKYWEHSQTCPNCKKDKTKCFNSEDDELEDCPPKPKRRRQSSD